MRRSLSRAALAAGVALAALPGCPHNKEEPVAPPASDASVRPSSGPRAGVKVPLPPGWTALVAADGSFQAGPPGRPVLRVDLRPGEGSKLPTSAQLADALTKRFPGYTLSLEPAEDAQDVALLRVMLSLPLADGGVGPESPALFGARRVGRDLFLCSTLPGVSSEEVRLSAEACRDMEVQAAPR